MTRHQIILTVDLPDGLQDADAYLERLSLDALHAVREEVEHVEVGTRLLSVDEPVNVLHLDKGGKATVPKDGLYQIRPAPRSPMIGCHWDAGRCVAYFDLDPRILVETYGENWEAEGVLRDLMGTKADLASAAMPYPSQRINDAVHGIGGQLYSRPFLRLSARYTLREIPRCGMDIPVCREKGEHSPVCTCDLDKDHNGICQTKQRRNQYRQR